MRKVNFAIGIAMLLALALVPAAAVSYTMSVQTEKASYTNLETIRITGAVSPTPGPNNGVFITVKNSNGELVDIASVEVDATYGSFSHNTVAGGTSSWIDGRYTVNASWGGSGNLMYRTTTFLYSYGITTTTTSTAQTTTESTTSVIPEFNAQALLLVSIISLAAAALLAKGKLLGTRVGRL
jgi:hypothetical protein